MKYTRYRRLAFAGSAACFCFLRGASAEAANGTDAANFLDIPVGAAPAALGSSYATRADDAYAPIFNAAGLGFTDGVRFSGSQSAYLQGVHYSFLGLAVPFGGGHGRDTDENSFSPHSGIGASIQYLGSGNIVSRDEFGGVIGSFSTTFAAYSLSFGQSLTDEWSIGVTAKAITEDIAGASASGYAGDFGTMFRPSDRWTLAATATNFGTRIKFVDESDALPLALRAGALYRITSDFNGSMELIDRHGGPFGVSTGFEWSYQDFLVTRFGIDSSHSQGLSTLSLFTAGVGLRFWGQEFSFAWVPYGDLGNTYDFSLDLRFGGGEDQRRLRSTRDNHDSDNDQLNDLLSDDEKRAWPH